MLNLYKSIPAMTPTGTQIFFTTDENLKVTALSDHLLFITGNTGPQVTGFHIQHLFVEGSCFFQHISLKNALELKCIFFTAASLKLSNGDTLSTYWHVTPVKDSLSNKVKELRWHGFEIPFTEVFSGSIAEAMHPFTLVYHNHAAIRPCNPVLSNQTDIVPVMIWITDDYHETLYVNQCLSEYTGTKPGGQPGKNWQPEFHPDDAHTSILEQHTYSSQYIPITNFSRIKHRSGDYRWFFNLALPIYLDEDFYPCYITYFVEMKDEQVKAIKQAGMEKKLSACIDRVDNETTIVNLKKAFEFSSFPVVLEKSKEDLFEVFISEMQEKDIFQHDIWQDEIVFRRHEEENQVVYLSINLVTRPSGECVGMVITNRDISSNKKSEPVNINEAGLHVSPEDNSQDCISFHTPDGLYLYVSEGLQKLTGYESAELIGQNPGYLCSTADDDSLTPALKQHQAKKSTSTVEYRIHKKNAQSTWLQATIQPFVDLQNNVIGLQVNYRDITIKKLKNEAPVFKPLEFQILAENAQTAIFRLNDQIRFTYCNAVFEKMLQFPFEKLLGKTPAAIGLTGDTLEKLSKEVGYVFESGKRITLPVDILKKDGTDLCFLTTLIPEFNGNKVQSVLAISNDITDVRKKEDELKSKEKELISSNERFSLVVKATTDAIWEFNLETGQIYLSEEFINKFGYTEKDLKYKPGEWYLKRIHPQDRESALNKLKRAFLNHEPFWKDEFRWMCKNGTYKYILNQASILYNESREPYKGIGAIQDITERKFNEELLIRKEKLLSAVAVSSNELLVEQNLNISLRDCLENIGKSADVDRVVLYELMQDADDTNYLGLKFKWNAGAGEAPVNKPELSYVPVSRLEPFMQGEVFHAFVKDIQNDWLRENLQVQGALSFLTLPLFVNGKWWGCLVLEQCSHERLWRKTEIDIFKTFTSSLSGAIERKEKDKKLKDSEEKFKALFINSLDIIFVVGESCKVKYVAPGIDKLLKYSAQSLIGKCWFDLIHPDDLDRILGEFKLIVEEPEHNLFANIRVQNTRDEWIWMEAKGQNKCLDPNIRGIIFCLRDITERQHAQQTLTEYSEMITGILNSITDGFAAIDKNATITLWNHVAEKLIGNKKDEVVGKNLWVEFPVLVNSSIQVEIKKALLHKTTVNFEQHIRSLDRWFDVSMYPYEDGLFIYFKDVTVKKKQEMFLAIEKNVLEINSNPKSSLKNTVDLFLTGIEKIHPDILCSVLMMDENNSRVNHLSAPRLPEHYTEAINGMKTGQNMAPCISAMFVKQRVNISDIATHPLWDHLKDIALESGLKACWSIPILNAQEEVMGALACYYQEPKVPEEEEINVVERTANLLRVIIENKRAEQKVRISNDLFTLATRATNQAVWNLDVKSEVLNWGEGFYRLFGYISEYKVNTFKFWVTHIHPEDREKVIKGLRNFMRNKSPDFWEDEYRLKKSDGNYARVVNKGYIIYDNNGDPIQMVGSIEDVTERKRLEKKLLKQEIDKQKLVAQAVVDAQEKERATIGKELHDNVNQVLSTAKLFLEVAKTNAKERTSLINRSAEQIRHAINEIRNISQSLVPPSIGDLGLTESIKDLVENIEVTKTLYVNYSNVGDVENSINDNQKVMLFRIIQEQVNNVLKHAEAKHLNIQLTVDNAWIELIITDDGKGFIPETVKGKKGVGLSNIASRAELFNGKVKIISAPGKGCKVIVKVLRIHN